VPGPADDPGPCLRSQGSACVLNVVVTPNAPRTRSDGLHDGCLRVRLAAPPVDGKANAALQAWLAGELGLPRRDVQLLQGLTARRKQLRIELPLAAVGAWLQRQLVGEPCAGGLVGGAGGAGGVGGAGVVGAANHSDKQGNSGQPGSASKAGAAAP
jgi:uncharacterized protein (TIGR00251 family)